MLSVPTLIAAGITPTQAKIWVGPLQSAASSWKINTPVRQAMWVAQCAHESNGFADVEEGLYYSSPERIMTIFKSSVHDLATAQRLAKNPKALANCVYANRLGNGDEASGDGWKYRGRGLIQLTGRANYADCMAGDGWGSYESHPDVLTRPSHAAWSAGWFFASKGCLPLADSSNVDAVTRIINGAAMLGLEDRKHRFAQAMRAFVG